MTKNEFIALINGVSFMSFKFAEEYLKNKLVPEFKYDVYLNISNDSPSLKGFDVYPEDNDKVEYGISDIEVADLIYKKGKVPVWIDIAVCKSDKKHTTFKLLCAGRYSDDVNEYYYFDEGTGPFGIKSPNLPFGYKKGKKFRL